MARTNGQDSSAAWRRRPSPSMVVAMIALVVALGGTSYAAIKLPAKSVGAKQLKRNAVTGSKVKDHSLFRNDFAAGQIPAGPAGPAGPPGPAGAPGAPGAAGSAVAYGRVALDGTVSGGRNLAFLGRGTAGIKVYCFDNTAGGVANVQVTVDSQAADPLFAKVSVNVDRSTLDAFGCPAAADFLVATDTTDGDQRGIDMGFFVAVIA